MRTTCAAIALVITALLGLAPAEPPAEPPAGTDFGAQARVMFRVAACGGDDAIPERFSARAIARALQGDGRDLRGVQEGVGRPGAGVHRGAAAQGPAAGGGLSVRGRRSVVGARGVSRRRRADHDLAGGRRRRPRDRHDQERAARRGGRPDRHRDPPAVLRRALDDQEPAGRVARRAARHDPVRARRAGGARHGAGGAALLRHRARRVAELPHERPARRARGRVRGQEARRRRRPGKVTHYWYEQVSAFANVEIQFRPRGDARAPLRTYRHIVANLDDSHMAADDRVLRHLRARARWR